MEIVVSSPKGLASVLQDELKKLGFIPHQEGSMALLSGAWQDVCKLNLQSCIANKIYIRLLQAVCSDFDTLFNLLQTIVWSDYVARGQGIRLLVQHKDSQLHSQQAIQSVAHKAIVSKLTGDRQAYWDVDPKQGTVEIVLSIYRDTFAVLLDTSGATLHERGYRQQAGGAPIKENLAAGLLYLAGWDKRSPLYDPFCGSGTICIEAAMMANNMAPGKQRSFAFQKFPCFDQSVWAEVSAQLAPGSISAAEIHGSDLDSKMIAIAQMNARHAGVESAIQWSVNNFRNLGMLQGYCVTNPPYGQRLAADEQLYRDLVDMFVLHNLRGGFISPHTLELGNSWQAHKIWNGGVECYFYTVVG